MKTYVCKNHEEDRAIMLYADSPNQAAAHAANHLKCRMLDIVTYEVPDATF